MKNLIVGSWVGVLGLLMLSACDSGGGTCANTPACGGDIVGTWNITSSCVTALPSMMGGSTDCPGAKTTSSNLSISGTIAYKADLTYSSNATVSGSVTVFTPNSCLSGFTCAELNAIIASDPTAPPGTHCATSGAGCSCTIVEMNQTTTTSGTYTTTAAGVLTETQAGSTADQSDYCVKGTVLTVSPHADSTMMGADVSGTITLSKQ